MSQIGSLVWFFWFWCLISFNFQVLRSEKEKVEKEGRRGEEVEKEKEKEKVEEEEYGSPPLPCDSLVPQYCSFPFPNDYWLIKDENLNPIRLNLTENNLPRDLFNYPINANYVVGTLDGFSPNPVILAYFEDIDIAINCAPLWNIGMSIDPNLEDTYPVIILDTVTNERIPHWVELDHISDDPFTGNEANRTLMIWPAHRLTDSRRYIVAFRNLYTNNGQPVELSEAFVALRDNVSSDDVSVNWRRDYFNTQIFNVLEENGVDRSTLQLAWDFTVMSTYTQTNAMVYMRDDAFSRIDTSAGGVNYRITSIENDYDPQYIARKINGLMSVPWYLNKDIPGMDVRLVYEWDNPNQPVYQKHVDVQFELLIPYSVANHSLTGRWVQYGHGLFGNFHEIESGYLMQQSNQYGYVFAGVNWLGMCDEDLPFISEIVLTNFTDFPMVPDRLHQGMLDALYLMKLLMSPKFLSDPALQFDEERVIDSSLRNYYGNSLGGIMGSVYMSLTTDVIRGTIGVPGFPFSLLLPRSCDFTTFEDIIKVRYTRDMDRVFLITFLELPWTRLEPAGYLPHISDEPFPDTPKHTVLIQYSLGDAQVSWLGAEEIGRTLGASMYQSNVAEYNETLFGFQFIPDDKTINTTEFPGSHLIQGWNYNEPQVPFVNRPPDCADDTHEFTRRQQDAIEANNMFWTQGIIYNACGGPCNGQPTQILEKHYVNPFKKRSTQEKLHLIKKPKN